MPLTPTAEAVRTLRCAECGKELPEAEAWELQRLSPEGELILEDLCPSCTEEWKLQGTLGWTC
jgi:phage FluMu protein Com